MILKGFQGSRGPGFEWKAKELQGIGWITAGYLPQFLYFTGSLYNAYGSICDIVSDTTVWELWSQWECLNRQNLDQKVVSRS